MRGLSGMIDTLWTLPDGWEWVTLDDACKINPRKPRINRQDSELTSFLPMANVDENEGKITMLETRPYQEVARGFTYFEENDVLFAKITPCMENGKCAIAYNLIDNLGFGSTEFHVLRPEPKILPEWIFYYIRRLNFRNEAKNHFRGAVGQQRVPKDFIQSYSIPIPYPNNPKLSLDIQQRIVARIESLFEEIKRNRLLLEKMRLDTDELMDSALNEVFSSNNEFQQVPLKQKCHVIMGQSPSGRTYSNTPIGLPLLNGPKEFGTYHPTPIQWTSEPTKICEPEDLLICVRGATTGRTNWADQRYCIGRGIATIRSQNKQNTDIRFIAHFIQSQATQILKAGRGSTFPNISKGDLENWKIPDISIYYQKQLVSHFDFIQAETVKIDLMLKEDEQNFKYLEQAILEKAFRGEL